MGSIAAMLLLGGMVRLTSFYWFRHAGDEDGAGWRALAVWLIRGWMTPVLLWGVFNLGFSHRLPPLWPAMAPKGPVADQLAAWCSLALVVGSWWVAVTFGWLIVRLCLHTESRREILHAGIFWSALALPPAAVVIYFGGRSAIGFAAMIWLWPILRDLLALGTPRRIPPIYARALAKMSAGDYPEAEREVLRQLEKCEDDFEGWMMLAGLYASHFNDLPEAERTVQQLCSQPRTTRSQVSTAMHRLADWHLSVGRDPAAACRALQVICDQFPATHYADVAQSRIRDLSGVSAGSSAAS